MICDYQRLDVMLHSSHMSRQDERKGRGNARFLHCRNCDSLAVVAVAHFDPHLASRHLAATGRADDCFCHLQLWLS